VAAPLFDRQHRLIEYLRVSVTDRCNYRCTYCVPDGVAHASRDDQLSFDEITALVACFARLGVRRLRLTGGEPTVRRDLPALVRHANAAGLYSNLITSGVLLDAAALAGLVEAGLEHVQISIQDSDPANGDRIAGLPAAQEKKRAVAALVVGAGLPLTVNAVVHRQNLDRLPEMLDLAVAWGAGRIEIAHVQYYGWALANRAALLPTRIQLDRATDIVEAARQRLKGVLAIDYVVPDYYAERPKACMGGWGRRFLNVSPAGKVLPCHAAESLPGFTFPDVRRHSLAEIWYGAEAFNRFRGTDWLPEPCRSCERKEIDFGGCRCQAFALTGDVTRTDPACILAPDHALLDLARHEADVAAPDFIYRRIGQSVPVAE